MPKNAKATKVTIEQTSEPSAPGPGSTKNGGTLSSKIIHVLVADLKKGDKVLYPGNKVIPVDEVQMYIPTEGLEEPLIVVKFEGQPKQCYLAFEIDAKVYVYAG